jgi:hypothetical protein
VLEHELFAEKNVSAEFSHQGVSSLVCILDTGSEKYVLKTHHSIIAGNGEPIFLKQWEGVGVKTPHVLEYGKLGETTFSLMEFVDAPILNTQRIHGMLRNGIWQEVGQTLARMHEAKSSGFGRPAEGGGEFETFEGWAASESVQKRIIYVVENGLVHEEAARSSFEVLNAYTLEHPETCFCHYDFTAPNMFATEPITVFDPNPTHAPGLLDIARTLFLTHCSGLSEEAEEIKKGYFGTEDPDKELFHAALVWNALNKFAQWGPRKKDEEIGRGQAYQEKN